MTLSVKRAIQSIDPDARYTLAINGKGHVVIDEWESKTHPEVPSKEDIVNAAISGKGLVNVPTEDLLELMKDVSDRVAKTEETIETLIDMLASGDFGSGVSAPKELKESVPTLITTGSQIEIGAGSAKAVTTASYKAGFYAPAHAIQKPGEWLEFRSTNSVFVGLVPLGVIPNKWSQMTVAWYMRTASQAWVSIGGDFGSKDTSKQFVKTDELHRLIINESSFIELQQRIGDRYETLYTYAVPVFAPLSPAGVFNAAGSEVTDLRVGRFE